MPSDRITHLLEPEQGDKTPPPAPPPMQTSSQNHNPYGFITDPVQPGKKKLLPAGGSKKARILVIAGGALVLIVIVVFVMGLLGHASAGVKEDYASLAGQQADLIHIAGIGVTKAQSVDARNLATTSKYILISEQPAIFKTAKKIGVKTDAKALAVSRDTKIDAILTTAAQQNQFDAVFTKAMQTKLKKYQQTIKKVYDETTTKSTKDALGKDFTDIGELIGNQQNSTPSQ